MFFDTRLSPFLVLFSVVAQSYNHADMISTITLSVSVKILVIISTSIKHMTLDLTHKSER